MRIDHIVPICLALFVFSLISTKDVSAQVRFRPLNKITIGNIKPYDSYGLTMVTDGLFFTCKGGNFLKMDVMPSNPRISGTGDQVVFYNTATSSFNSIQVKKVFTYSDVRAKTSIRSLSDGLMIINRLRPVTYRFADERYLLKRTATGSQEIGLIAQEVEAVLPEIVYTDEEGHKLINYDALIPVLIESVKSLSSQVEDLKREVNYLQSLH